MVITILFASENNDKYLELKHFLDHSMYSDLVKIVKIKPTDEIHEIQSLDRSEIVNRKIMDAHQHTKDIILQNHIINNSMDVNHDDEYYFMVEDTSFCIDKQGGFPGPFIKYYLKSQTLNFISNTNWGSSAQSIVTLCIGKLNKHADIISKRVFEGIINGVIVKEQGSNGFGYDPIFRPEGSICTNASLTMTEKELFNPRIEAFKKILTFIIPNL